MAKVSTMKKHWYWDWNEAEKEVWRDAWKDKKKRSKAWKNNIKKKFK
jgi:hypothetical protein